MRSFAAAFSLCVAFLLGITASVPAEAQGNPSLVPQTVEAPASGDDAARARIADIMKEAAANGLGVVVIDTQGNVLAQDAPPVPEAVTTMGGEGPAKMEGGALMRAQDAIVTFRAALVQRILDLPNAINEVLYILRATSPDGTIWAYFKVFYLSLSLFGIGYIVEKQIYGKRFARRFVVARTVARPQGYSEKMPFLVFRFFLGVIGILISMLVAYVIGTTFLGPIEDVAIQFTITLINIAYFLSRFVADLWRMILSPYLEQYRIPVMSTPDAKRLHRWLVTLGTIDIFAILFGVWISELGLNYDFYAFLAALMSALVVLLNILMVALNGRALSNAIRGGMAKDQVTWGLRFISVIWAPVVIFYVLFAWVELTYDLVLGNPSSIPLLAGAYGILLTIIVVYGVINFIIERSFERGRKLRDLNEATADDEAAASASEPTEALRPPVRRISTFEELARRVAAILAFVAGIYAFFYIWDNEGAEMAETYADSLLDIMVIIFLGYIVYQAFRIWIDNKILEEQGDMEEGELGDEGGATSASRLATLLPLFRNFILIVVMVSIALLVLLQVGINVGPLFAGAGVIGIAIGFGSQALVRDIFSGGFFLFDDAFRKGEYLDVGGVKGTVEKISVRSFQLRHHLGALHTIPFGELQVMTNYSRDWVIMKLPLRVTYDTDVEKVRKLIKKLGVELLDDPVIGKNFIQPLKSQGVIEMQDSAMIIRVKFMTKPGDQWLVRKRVYEDIRELFAREGIKFAHKEVTVRLADGKVGDLSDKDKEAITAAAQASIEEDEMGGEERDGDDR
jgi:small-conductance mechanosensitive channel